MSIKKKFSIYFVIIFVVILLAGGSLVWEAMEAHRYLNQEFPQVINKAEKISDNSGLGDNLRKIESNFNFIINRCVSLALSFMVIFLILMAFLLGLIVNNFFIPMYKFQKAAREISKGNLRARAEISSQDEMGELAKDLSAMMDRLQDSLENVEKKVEKRTNSLNKLNSFMVGRELKMIELKKEIEALKKNKDED